MRPKMKFLISTVLAIACGLGLADAASTAAPKLKSGEKFSYVTTGGAVKSSRPGYDAPRGAAMVAPLPKHQTVVVGETTPCQEHTCQVINAELVIPPFVPGIKADSFGKKIRALIDLQTGDVLDIRTTLTMGSSVSESSEARYQPESTVAEFYGPWMTELKDGYTRSFTIATSGEVRTFTVAGREKVDGRDCFVVERVRKLPSNQVVEAKLWVDAERRVSLRIQQEGQTMSLGQ